MRVHRLDGVAPRPLEAAEPLLEAIGYKAEAAVAVPRDLATDRHTLIRRQVERVLLGRRVELVLQNTVMAGAYRAGGPIARVEIVVQEPAVAPDIGLGPNSRFGTHFSGSS